MYAINVEKLTKKFGDYEVLRGVDLRARIFPCGAFES